MNFIKNYTFLLFLGFSLVVAQNQIITENSEKSISIAIEKQAEIDKKTELSKKQIMLCDGLIGWIIKKYDLDKKIVYELEIDEGAKVPLVTQSAVLNLLSFWTFWTLLSKTSKVDQNQEPVIDQKIAYLGILVLSGLCGVAKQVTGSLVSTPYNWVLEKVPVEGSYWVFKKIFQSAIKTLEVISVSVGTSLSDTITRTLIKKIA